MNEKASIKTICAVACGRFFHSLLMEETQVSHKENQKYDHGKDIAYIKSCPGGEFNPFPCICFLHEIPEAPAVPAGTEQKIYQASERKQVVADQKILKIKDRTTWELQAALTF